jgi:integrase
MSLHFPRNEHGQTSPYLSAQFRGPQGKVVNVGTKLRERRLARKLEAVWKRAAEDGRNGFLDAAGARRYVEECSRICRGDSLKQSEKFINSCLQVATGAGLNVVFVETYFRDWLQSKTEGGRNSQSTLDAYSRIINRFLVHLDARRSAPLTSVTAMDCHSFLRAERSRGVSAVTSNQSIRVLRIAFNLARRQALIPTNPADAVELSQESPEKRLPFTLDQVRSILEVADTEWTGAILMGLHAGIRLGDVAKLTWGNLDMERNVVVFQAQKTARRKKGDDKNTVIDLHRDIVSYIRTLQPGVPAAPLFPTLSRKSVGSSSGLSAGFRTLMDKAGILSPLGNGKGAKMFRALSFHSLRHTYVSQLASAGVPIELRMALAGHSSDTISLGYTHVNRSLTAAAIAALPSVERAA